MARHQARKEEAEVEEVDAEVPEAEAPTVEASVAPVAPVGFTLILSPALVAVVRDHRAGRATSDDLSVLWSALYTAAGLDELPAPRVYGK